MSLKLHVPESRDLKPRLTVFGVGGAGGNAVNNMIARSLEGVEFVVANTDAQSLTMSDANCKVQLGEELTEGLGAGAKPEIGARAAEESIDKITDYLMGSHMCFITAGMGGGTGTGAAPIIAQAAREMGILTVGVVTKPFLFEGSRRMNQAEAGIKELQQYVDTLIIIPNQNLFRIANEKTTFTEAFGMADDVLYQGVKGVTDLMVRPGLVNLDFADIRSVMDEMGKAMMGTGEAEGDDRATIAAERAIANPLLDEISLQGARGVLINITGGDDMTLHEVDEASNKIRNEVDGDANIIFGSTYDPEMTGHIRVSVVATGIDVDESSRSGGRSASKPKKAVAEKPAEPDEADLFNRNDDDDVSGSDDLSDDRVEYSVSELDIEDVAEGEQFEIAESVEVETVATYSAQELEGEASVSEDRDDSEKRYSIFRSKEHGADADEIQENVQNIARAEPVSAPPVETLEKTDDKQGGRFSIDSMIKRMSHSEEKETAQVASRPDSSNDEPIATRRVDKSTAPRPQAESQEAQRVDIPAFLRRRAN